MSSHKHQGGEEYSLKIVARADDDAPPIVRLRRAIKALGRTFGFRVVDIRETTPKLPPQPQVQNHADGAPGKYPNKERSRR